MSLQTSGCFPPFKAAAVFGFLHSAATLTNDARLHRWRKKLEPCLINPYPLTKIDEPMHLVVNPDNFIID